MYSHSIAHLADRVPRVLVRTPAALCVHLGGCDAAGPHGARVEVVHRYFKGPVYY